METSVRRALPNSHACRGSAVAAVVAVLALAGQAQAHVTVTPPFVEAEAATTLSFEMPNERVGRTTTSLTIEAPPGVELEAVEAPDGWRLEVEDGRAVWAGGRLTGEVGTAFPLLVTARTPAGLQTFRATQGYDDGEAVQWEATLTVLPAAEEEAPPQHFRRAVLAGAVGLAVIAASLVLLRRLRRGSLQDR